MLFYTNTEMARLFLLAKNYLNSLIADFGRYVSHHVTEILFDSLLNLFRHLADIPINSIRKINHLKSENCAVKRETTDKPLVDSKFNYALII